MKLELVSFGLPPTFPPELMPEAGARFVAECRAGMSQRDLVCLAEGRGWRPSWHALPHMGEHVFGFGLTIDGCGVPLMVRMRRIEQPAAPAGEQASLFLP